MYPAAAVYPAAANTLLGHAPDQAARHDAEMKELKEKYDRELASALQAQQIRNLQEQLQLQQVAAQQQTLSHKEQLDRQGVVYNKLAQAQAKFIDMGHEDKKHARIQTFLAGQQQIGMAAVLQGHNGDGSPVEQTLQTTQAGATAMFQMNASPSPTLFTSQLQIENPVD